VPLRLDTGLRRRLCDERGIALIVALGTMLVFGIVGTSVFLYSTQNAASTRSAMHRQDASAVAESGLRAAFSVLAVPANNALSATLLPACATATAAACNRLDLPTGYAYWGGTLDSRSGVWTLVSTGFVRNSDNVRTTALFQRTMKASVTIKPTVTQPLNNPAWNYIYATHPATPGVCDEIVQQSVQIASPFFVEGNLCLQNTATIVSGPLDVKGSLTLSQRQNAVGSAASPITDAHIAGGCKYQNNAQHTPCLGAADNVFARTLDTTPSAITPPVVYWDAWYKNASPGPYFPCTTSSGVTPTFDTDQGSVPDATRRNNSVTTIFNLTPGASYSCQTAGGELSWDATRHLLTVSGTIFIDGSAYIQNGAVNSYNGQATLYLSGTFLMKNSKLCAGLNAGGTDCDTSTWDPNAELLAIIANGSGGQVNSWDSEQLVSATYQGALYATKSIDTDTTSSVDGPMCGDAVNLGQSVTTSFPTITTVPVRMPSNPTVYAQPQPPTYLSG